ncbi:MAG TPA: ABC transporter permease [Rhodobiaceae bacterium]|uniref:ABC transporter permease n=1 Tax=PS1 clade bacterium TaxID=2175152 RepID=A0A368EMM6_9PROT|nr:ABC transporter permease [Candidatus Micropelagos sp.]RCL84599.1 MAG: ABC transporter permease [PS1 clade bacterium]HCN32968.1 ABC transporter permease [Rhodobiaceae bacterium]
MKFLLPLFVGSALLVFWEWIVGFLGVPIFVLPPPSQIAFALIENFTSLMGALIVTLSITGFAYFWALVGGVSLAILFTRSRFIEMSLAPYVVTLQVTPVVAIAPLILIWVGFENTNQAMVIIAWIVAFFPILTNTLQGIRSVDGSLHQLLQLSGAKWWQILIYLELPAALPSILTGAKISGGLALIGAVVAEFVAGSGTSTGLAWRIIEAGNRLEIATMFAALTLLSILGIIIYYAHNLVEWILLRKWHESFN